MNFESFFVVFVVGFCGGWCLFWPCKEGYKTEQKWTLGMIASITDIPGWTSGEGSTTFLVPLEELVLRTIRKDMGLI